MPLRGVATAGQGNPSRGVSTELLALAAEGAGRGAFGEGPPAVEAEALGALVPGGDALADVREVTLAPGGGAQVLEVRQHVLGGPVALGEVLGHGFLDDVAELFRYLPVFQV